MLFHFCVIPVLNVPALDNSKRHSIAFLKFHTEVLKNVELSNLVEQFGFLDFKDKMSTVCKKCQAPRNLRFIKE